MSGTPATLFPGVALVTGAGSGIGRQVAISFAIEGCRKIALFDQNGETLGETEDIINAIAADAEVQLWEVDNLEADEVIQNMTLAFKHFGRIDYAVNCAGIYGPTNPSHRVTPAEFDHVMNTNFRGLWLCSREELKWMSAHQDIGTTHDGRPGFRGSIVNVGSNLGLVGKPETPVYSASKAAIISLTRSDAIDYANYQIRVNCVCPGVIETPMTADVPDDDPAVQTAVMKRKGTPQEVADAVLFLSSSKASFIQGSALSVDGGYTIS
ncbi:related to dehydrogenase [Fusarium torulosum]|uniref:Related to dehydrogenase n=1 Tax=Fusarium torulosum TaxID=33205 RepID=A0AAE8SEF5_9HYPO|nr:related to dehydrogenase [Fusarium torulosum]